MSCKEVAKALGWSESKVSRMETGERGLYADDVAAVLGFLRVPAKIRHELMDLVRSQNERNWHEIGGAPISRLLRDLIHFESDATAIYNFEPLLLPGLVQTAEYARTLMRKAAPTRTEQEIESMVAVRMNRQRVLDRADPPHLSLIIEEMALRRTMDDPGMMYRPAAAPAGRRRPPHTSASGSCPSMPRSAIATQGSLIILECPDQPTLCYEESRSTSAFLEDEEFIGKARLAWKKLSAAALVRRGLPAVDR